VPEERRIFPDLSVLDNLLLGIKGGKIPNPDDPKVWTIERIFRHFPRLKEREHQKGKFLSGGEQQMLTIGRSLLGNPKLLLVDEPTEGLAPLMVKEVRNVLFDINKAGVSMLLVEHNLKVALSLAHRVYLWASPISATRAPWRSSRTTARRARNTSRSEQLERECQRGAPTPVLGIHFDDPLGEANPRSRPAGARRCGCPPRPGSAAPGERKAQRTAICRWRSSRWRTSSRGRASRQLVRAAHLGHIDGLDALAAQAPQVLPAQGCRCSAGRARSRRR
jgi:hypothetical protein